MSLDGLEAVCVKHEPWDSQDGLTESATETPLFTHHMVKEDLGAEHLQPPDDSQAAALYEDHVVKKELVLGPELLQPRDVVYTLRDLSVINKDQSAEVFKYQADGMDFVKTEDKPDKHNTSLNNLITKFQEPSTSTQEDLPLKDEVPECSPERFFVNSSSGETYVWIKVTKFKCNTCGKDFSVWSDIEKHMHTHMATTYSVAYKSTEHFMCKTCGGTFDTKLLLLQHAKSQHGVKYFTCNECEYATIYSQNIRKHLRNHTGEKSYKCSQCSSAFNNSHNLQRHLRTHTGEKPYKCNQCSSTFSQRSDLRVHHRIHTGEKPFECNICGYKTTQSSALKSHVMSQHSGQKPFRCDSCSYTGATRGSLRKHLKRFHKLT